MMSDIAILIPTLGRAGRLVPLAWNIASTTPSGAYRIYFVIDSEDEATRHVVEAIVGPTEIVIVSERGYPHAINAGVQASKERLLLLCNDDVKFHDGWYEAAMDAFNDPSVQVVGGSDLSPGTENGDHANFPIVRRNYIRYPGASFGEPGRAMYEGYYHNFCDTELWDLAVHRGVAKFVPEFIIEHKHPDWNKRDLDDTDLRGNRLHWDDDQMRYQQRREQWEAIPILK